MKNDCINRETDAVDLKINTFLRKFHPKKKSMGESINISSAFGEEENNFKKIGRF